MTAAEKQRPGAGARPKPRPGVVRVAVAFVVAGVAALLTVVSWQAAPGWPTAVHDVLEAAFPLVIVVGCGIGGYELFVHPWLVTELARISGPRIVEALLPQQVMETFLHSIYGDNDANREVVTGVLGGEGLRPLGGDLTISTHTGVTFELSAVDHDIYHLTTAATYSFKKNVPVDRFIIFATCNALLRDSISAGCQLPLFETWFVPDSSLFESSVEDMLPSVRISIDYLDHLGRHQVAASGKVELREVKYQQWADYLTFFRTNLGHLPRQNTLDYLSDLRIFECDLSDIAGDDHSVSAIERLSLRATALQRIDDGYCYWQASYPCYVERISMSTKGLDIDGGGAYEFRVVPFTFRSNTASARWLRPEELSELDVRSWLLPGHGVALLWRPAK
ncbi:hypothetical protein GCM10027445_38410 [Amycolatopsis endophytica]|uniref:Uncharacterized protein n=1 Tax=Amycolatopsis endophytica TaxID=860233 RepID=A0A853B0F4_9PSEU|nr:hypothetical protein [Amycolatopsis endophytica]NYI88206.1 hypothetical protein [Amycolatopsis endophytica]